MTISRPAFAGEPNEFARVRRGRRHRLLDQHVAAARERRARMLEMKNMGRGDHDAVHFDAGQHLAIVLEAALDAEGALDLGKLARAEPVDGDDLAIGVRLEDRDMVHDRPPAGADDSDARATTHEPHSSNSFLIAAPERRISDALLAPLRAASTRARKAGVTTRVRFLSPRGAAGLSCT